MRSSGLSVKTTETGTEALGARPWISPWPDLASLTSRTLIIFEGPSWTRRQDSPAQLDYQMKLCGLPEQGGPVHLCSLPKESIEGGSAAP